jgi:hypothetical protein
VDNNYLDLGMNKSGIVHTFPSARLILRCQCHPQDYECQQRIINLNSICTLFIYRTVNDKMTFHSVSFEFIASSLLIWQEIL